MKKLVSILFICLSLLCVMTFTACGVEGSSAATGVKFTKKIFYVDLGIKTHLDYKVFPSSANNYAISYDFIGDYSESSYYTFQNGYIEVKDQKFSGIKVNISLNNYSDEAEVKLREYPQTISFDNAEDFILAGSLKTLELKGMFQNGQQRNCNNGEFNYKVTSTDESVISVVDSNALLVKSTGKLGKSEIKIKVLNGVGDEVRGLQTQIELTVRENIASAYLTLGNEIVEDGVKYTYRGDGEVSKEIVVKYFGDDGYWLQNSEYYIISDNDDAVEIKYGEDADAGKVYLCLKFPEEEGTDNIKKATITIQSKEKKSDGLPHKVTFTIELEKYV